MFPWSVEMHLGELFTSIITRRLPYASRLDLSERMVSLMKHSVKTPISHNHPLHRPEASTAEQWTETGIFPPADAARRAEHCEPVPLCYFINHTTCLHKIHSALLCSLSHAFKVVMWAPSSLTSLIDLLKRLQENVIFPKLLVVWIIWKYLKWLRWQFYTTYT